MKGYAPAEVVLILVGLTLCILAILFAVAGIMSEGFRGSGVTIAGTILGALTTMATIIIGATYARSLESRRNGNGGASNGNGGNGNRTRS